MDESKKVFIMERCEEITTSCHEYSVLNSKILAIEKELKSKLTNEELNIFIKYESLIIEQLTIAKYITYIDAINDVSKN